MMVLLYLKDKNGEGTEAAKSTTCLKQNRSAFYEKKFIELTNKSGVIYKTAYYQNTTVMSQSKIAMIVINGGPGASSFSTFHGMNKHSNLNKFPLIFFDQRGTGCSTPKLSQQVIKKDQELEEYTARYVASDVKTIIDTVKESGIKNFYLIGFSYGGIVALEVAKLIPKLIKHSYIFGYYPFQPTKQWLIDRQNRFQERLNRFLFLYPSTQQKILKMRKTIPTDHCLSNSYSKICGPNIVDSLYRFIPFESSWSTMVYHIYNFDSKEGKESFYNLAKNSLDTFLADVVSFSDYHPGKTFKKYCDEIKHDYTPSTYIDECRFSLAQEFVLTVDDTLLAPNPNRKFTTENTTFFLGENDPVVGSIPAASINNVIYKGYDHGLGIESMHIDRIYSGILKRSSQN